MAIHLYICVLPLRKFTEIREIVSPIIDPNSPNSINICVEKE
jgi:hypothetical protein